MQSNDTTSEISIPEMAAHDYDAALTMEDVRVMEEKFRDPLTGIPRRVTLLTLTKSKAEHVEGFIGDPEAFGPMLDEVEAYQGELKMMMELADAAHARLLIAGSECSISAGEEST